MSLAQLNTKAAAHFEDLDVGTGCIVVEFKETAGTSVTVLQPQGDDSYALRGPIAPVVKDGADPRSLSPNIALYGSGETIAIHRLLWNYDDAMYVSVLASDLPLLSEVMTLINHAKWQLNKELGDLEQAGVAIEIVDFGSETYFVQNTENNAVEMRLAVIKE
jgi:hypothetical protein